MMEKLVWALRLVVGISDLVWGANLGQVTCCLWQHQTNKTHQTTQKKITQTQYKHSTLKFGQLISKDNYKLILGTRQLAKLLKYISQTVGKLTKTEQMAITGKWHGCHFKNL